MITRRSFLAPLVSGVVVYTIVPTFAARMERFLAEHGAPLLEVPKKPKIVITARGDDETLHIGDPDGDFPQKSWRTFLTERGELPVKRKQLPDLLEAYGIDEDDLDSECYLWPEVWARTESSNALAFKYLDRLDLGPILEAGSARTGHLDFLDGPCPGNDYLGVTYSCNRALSHLQNRLNELGTGVAVVLA